MKHNIKNCLATTGMSLVLLAMVAVLYHARFLCIESVFQVLCANILIHAGLALLKQFESKYFIVEILAEIGYILGVLLIAGLLFGWYSSTPAWVLVLMGISVYFLGGLIGVFRIKEDVEYINHQLKLHKMHQ